jgi:hypothetical protein
VKIRPAVVAASAVVALAALLTAGSANAASPVLEFSSPGSLPIGFTTEGGAVLAELAGFETAVHCTGSSGSGEITGPRSAVSKYEFTGCATQHGSTVEATCESEGANPEEIRTGSIAAELVYLDEAKDEVGILMNPDGGVYMSFECGGTRTEARGAFLSSITPIDKQASSFTATLAESGAMQTPDEYENAAGERRKAIPEGKKGSSEWVTTGVASTITVRPSSPVEIRAITAQEVEAKQREAAARQSAEEALAAGASRQIQAAAAQRRHEEEVAAADRRRAEEAAEKKHAEEARAALRVSIHGALVASARATRIGALLRHGGLTLAFDSSEPGALVIQWWLVPAGAHLARHDRLKPILVAQGGTVFSNAGVGKVKVSLTRGGRRLLAHARKLKLTSRVRFRPTGDRVISATGTVALRR